MWRTFVLTSLLAASTAALAQTPALPCAIVYGHGRNLGSASENEAWDRVNLRFNEAIASRMEAAGRRTVPMLLRIASDEPARGLQAVLEEAQRQDCRLVLDSTVFADTANTTLVLRLRVHPLLPHIGPRVGPGLPRVGEAVYTSQRDFDLNPRVLERLRLDALAGEMVAGYLEDAASKP